VIILQLLLLLVQGVAQQTPDLPFACIAPDANDNMSGIR